MKDEFPPLLSPGFHQMSLGDLETLCVSTFTLSTTRKPIFDGLKNVTDTLAKHGVNGELWVDGSFLTEKIDPKDSDVVLCVSGEEYDLTDGAKRDTIDWLDTDEPKRQYQCDSYVHREYPEGHLWYSESVWLRAYWIKQFGFNRNDEMKGMALIKL